MFLTRTVCVLLGEAAVDDAALLFLEPLSAGHLAAAAREAAASILPWGVHWRRHSKLNHERCWSKASRVWACSIFGAYGTPQGALGNRGVYLSLGLGVRQNQSRL